MNNSMDVKTLDAAKTATAPVKTKMSEETRGLIYTIVSTVCYTISLSSLRGITNYPEVSSDWSIAVKELTTVACVTPLIVVQWLRGKFRFPTWRIVGLIILAGVTCQVLGARYHLASYAALGLALATPLIQAAQLLMASVLGVVFLKERVTKTRALALGLLVVAVWLLSGGASSLEREIAGKPIRLGAGLVFVILTAFGYSSELSIMRGYLRGGDAPSSTPDDEKASQFALTSLTMVGITGVGLLICGSILTFERGLDAWLSPPPICWAFVLTAGVCNMIGFYFQIESLRRLFVLKQTIVANVQTLLLALLGIFVYHEAFTWVVALGFVLVLVAVWLAGSEKQNAE